MSVKSAQSVTVLFSTANASTGAAADASSTPTGTLYVNGTANGATVTVTNITTGLYKAAVTLPSLSAGDVVSLRIAATVSAVAGEGVIWQEVADTERVSDLNDPTAATVATAVRSELATELGRIDASISDVPTNAELTSALAAADDAVLTAIAALNNLSSAQAQSAATAALTVYAPPTKSELDSAVSPLATAAALDIVDNLIDTEIGAIKTVTDKLDTALELDGAVYRYTANALELSPTGGSAPTAAAIADAVWDEAIAGHAVVGSTGQALASAGGAADPLLNLVPGDYASGTAGAALGSLAGATVTVVSPVAADGTAISLVYGDDYAAADNRALVFSALAGPTLTGGAVALRVQGRGGVVNATGTVTGAHSCYIELTGTQVASIGVGTWPYDLEVTLAVTANVATLVTGYVTVAADVR